MKFPVELYVPCREVLDAARFDDSEKDSALFGRVVRAWCDRLEWGAEVAEAALALWSDYADFPFPRLAMTRQVLSSLLAYWWSEERVPVFGANHVVGAWLERWDRDEERVKRLADKVVATMNFEFHYALVALAVASAGYVVYRARSRGKAGVRAGHDVKQVQSAKSDECREQTSIARQSNSPPSSLRRGGDFGKSVLVLVISVRKQMVVDVIRRDGIDALEEDALFDAVQSIWLGSSADFKASLGMFFEAKDELESESEYDVYLVKVEIGADDSGLRRDQNRMDRIDAFRRLCKRKRRVDVSSRLSVDACGTDEFYRR